MLKTYRRVVLSTVRETAAAPYVGDANGVARLLGGLIGDKPQEEFYAVYLDTRHRVIGVHQVSRGTADSSGVHPRDVFGPALLLSATALIVAHNHPSGDLSPSRDDEAITNRLAEAGQLLGIHLLDHLILGHDERYYSFAEGHTRTF